MTLAQAITRVLSRCGLSTTSTTYKDRAREYINQILAEIAVDVPWWWLDRTTTFDTVSGTRTYQPVSGNVTAWHSFVDTTDERALVIVGPDEYDMADLDRDETGNVDLVFIGGIDTSTGYPTVELYRIPDSTNTIRVRYRADIDEWTSASDDLDLLSLGVPRIIESVLISGATAYYLEELGDDSGSGRESGNFDRTLSLAKKQNLAMQGNRRFAPDDGFETNDLMINVGSDVVVA